MHFADYGKRYPWRMSRHRLDYLLSVLQQQNQKYSQADAFFTLPSMNVSCTHADQSLIYRVICFLWFIKHLQAIGSLKIFLDYVFFVDNNDTNSTN